MSEAVPESNGLNVTLTVVPAEYVPPLVVPAEYVPPLDVFSVVPFDEWLKHFEHDLHLLKASREYVAATAAYGYMNYTEAEWMGALDLLIEHEGSRENLRRAVMGVPHDFLLEAADPYSRVSAWWGEVGRGFYRGTDIPVFTQGEVTLFFLGWKQADADTPERQSVAARARKLGSFSAAELVQIVGALKEIGGFTRDVVRQIKADRKEAFERALHGPGNQPPEIRVEKIGEIQEAINRAEDWNVPERTEFQRRWNEIRANEEAIYGG